MRGRRVKEGLRGLKVCEIAESARWFAEVTGFDQDVSTRCWGEANKRKLNVVRAAAGKDVGNIGTVLAFSRQ